MDELEEVVGETPEQVEAARHRRAVLVARINALIAQYQRVGRRDALALSATEAHLIRSRMARANSAKFWLDLDDSSDERLFFGFINAMRFGMMKGAYLPKGFYDEEKVQKRTADAETAAAFANFAGLPKLTGSPKQVAWANTIRMEKLRWLGADYAIAVQALPGANTARFWIDNRDEEDIESEEFAARAHKVHQLKTQAARSKWRRKPR